MPAAFSSNQLPYGENILKFARIEQISYIYVFLQLLTFSYVLRWVSRNVLSYEFPAECQPLHSFF